jgi:hypothetical protein
MASPFCQNWQDAEGERRRERNATEKKKNEERNSNQTKEKRKESQRKPCRTVLKFDEESAICLYL